MTSVFSESIDIIRKRSKGQGDSTLDRSDALHAVFALAPGGSSALIRERLGVSGVDCRTVGLEEMFIELAGGQS